MKSVHAISLLFASKRWRSHLCFYFMHPKRTSTSAAFFLFFISLNEQRWSKGIPANILLIFKISSLSYLLWIGSSTYSLEAAANTIKASCFGKKEWIFYLYVFCCADEVGEDAVELERRKVSREKAKEQTEEREVMRWRKKQRLRLSLSPIKGEKGGNTAFKNENRQPLDCREQTTAKYWASWQLSAPRWQLAGSTGSLAPSANEPGDTFPLVWLPQTLTYNNYIQVDFKYFLFNTFSSLFYLFKSVFSPLSQ